MIKLTKIFVLCLLVSLSQVSFSQIHLLSGLEGGTYNSLANDIAKISSLKVKVSTSNGSVDNIKQLMSESDVSVTFLQYDVLLTNEMMNPKLRDQIRVYFPLFLDEEIHLITKKDSEIDDLEDIRGLKVGVGIEGQGTMVTAQMIKNKTGVAWVDVNIASNKAYDALKKGEIDAFFYVGGIPVNSLHKLGKDAGIKMVNITHKNLEDMYRLKTIKKGTYAWQTAKVKTFAVPTLMVVRVDELTKEKEVSINKLRTEIQSNLKKLEGEGHSKWKDVYLKNQKIRWPYYYQRNVVE